MGEGSPQTGEWDAAAVQLEFASDYLVLHSGLLLIDFIHTPDSGRCLLFSVGDEYRFLQYATQACNSLVIVERVVDFPLGHKILS